MREMKNEEYRQCKNEAQALVKEKRKRLAQNEEERLTRDFETNNKLFWREARKSRGLSSISKIDRTISKAGEILANPNDVLDRWSEYFGDMYEYAPNVGAASESPTGHAAPTSDKDITVEDIEWSIRLKNGKATEIEMMSAEIIKLGETCVWEAFLCLSNLC